MRAASWRRGERSKLQLGAALLYVVGLGLFAVAPINPTDGNPLQPAEVIIVVAAGILAVMIGVVLFVNPSWCRCRHLVGPMTGVLGFTTGLLFLVYADADYWAPLDRLSFTALIWLLAFSLGTRV